MRALLISVALVASSLGALGMAAGCSGSIAQAVAGGAGGGTTGTAGTGGVAGGPGADGCGAGPVWCNGKCTGLEGDPENCGSCGHACPAGEPCKDRACVAPACTGTMGLPGVPDPGVQASAVAVGDVDGDGKVDLAAVNPAGVEVARGNGDGTFGAGVILPVPSPAVAVAVGDLDGDGLGDLVVTQEVGVSLLFATGGGVLGAPVALSTGTGSARPAVRDLDGDGRPEIILADTAGVKVLKNLGGGSFAPPVDSPAPGSQPVVGDVDGDGLPDVLVVGDQGVTILRNQGGGVLGAGVVVPAGSGPVAMGMGDVNGDGRPDLAVLRSGSDGFDVLLNEGGTFAAPAHYPGPALTLGLGVADMNGDGLFDVLMVGLSGISISPSTGSGFATPVGDWQSPASGLLAADLNADGRPDVVTVPLGNPLDLVGVALNRGDGSLVTGLPHVLPDAMAEPPGDVAAADLDDDGRVDLALAHQGAGKVSILRGQGDGTFDSGTDLPVPAAGTRGILVADLDSDTEPDLVVETISPAGWSWIRNLGKGGFAASVSVAPDLRSLRAVDVVGDSQMDLVGLDPSSAQVTVLPGMGGGTFFAPLVVPGATGQAVAVGDFDGDLSPDFAVLTGAGVETLRNQGGGIWLPWDQIGAPGDWSALEVGDVNGDGAPDLVLGGQDAVTVVRNEGGHAWAAPDAYPLGLTLSQTIYQMRLVDVDSDGALDIVATFAKDGPLVVLQNQGGGTFATPRDYTAGWSTGSLAAADLNGDGRLDLVIVDGENLNTVDPGPGYSALAVLLGACLP